MTEITIAEDLSKTTAIREDGSWLILAGHNPLTTDQWGSAEAIEAFINNAPDFLWSPADRPMNPPPPVPDSVSDRQFFQALWKAELITKEEALAAVKTGAIPNAMQDFITLLSNFDPDAAESAEFFLSGATTFERSNYIVPVFGSMYGMTTEQIDDLWRLAATL